MDPSTTRTAGRDMPRADRPYWVLRERKDAYNASSSSKVLACFKSSVSKPSVNQP
jgi:hypothetical protein